MRAREIDLNAFVFVIFYREKHRYTVEQEMLHYASLLKGQSLIITMNGRNQVKRNGLACFVDACR